MIGADSDQLHITGFTKSDGTIPEQLHSLTAVKNGRQFCLGNRHGPELPLGSKTLVKARHSTIAVGRIDNAGSVTHFSHQDFAEGRVLMRLLVLAVFPEVRRRNDRHG